jgi:hypothetical protein
LQWAVAGGSGSDRGIGWTAVVVVHRRGSAIAVGSAPLAYGARRLRCTRIGSDDLRRWFGAYLEVFEACGRGSENGFGRLLDYYDVPFLLSGDEGVLSLTSGAEVRRALQRQIDGMRAAGYHRSEVLESHVEALNMVSSRPGLAITTLAPVTLDVLPAAVRGEPQETRRIVLARLRGPLEGPAAAVADALSAASPA